MRQGWVPISFSETNPRESALPFVAEGERQNFRRHFHPFSLSLAFVPRFTVNLNRLHGMRSSASQFQLSRTPLAALGLPWGYPGVTLVPTWTYPGTIEVWQEPPLCPVVGHSTSLLLPLSILHCHVNFATAEA